jgi:hypothetical protein
MFNPGRTITTPAPCEHALCAWRHLLTANGELLPESVPEVPTGAQIVRTTAVRSVEFGRGTRHV